MSILSRLKDRASLRALARMADDENFQFVHRCHLFQELDPGALVFVMERILERRYRRHEPIFQQGNPGICLYLVRSGRVEIFTDEEESDGDSTAVIPRTLLARVGEGRVFGELSVLSVTYRTTSARAIDPGTTLLTLSSYDMDALMARYPHDSVKLLRGVTDTLAHNLIETNRRVLRLQADVRILETELQTLRGQAIPAAAVVTQAPAVVTPQAPPASPPPRQQQPPPSQDAVNE